MGGHCGVILCHIRDAHIPYQNIWVQAMTWLLKQLPDNGQLGSMGDGAST